MGWAWVWARARASASPGAGQSSGFPEVERVGGAAATVAGATVGATGVLDAAGNPVIGTEAVTEIVDLWTFERNLKSKDLTWRLSAARSG